MALREWNLHQLNGVPLVRPPLQQTRPNGCRFAAVARHADYEIRLAFARALPAPIYLAWNGDLVDQAQLRREFEESNYRSRQLSPLLRFLRTAGVVVYTGQRLPIALQPASVLAEEHDGVVAYQGSLAERVELLRQRLDGGTLLGTMPIYDDYRAANNQIYMGIGQIRAYHTVVILGLRRIDPNDEYPYFIFQDSHGPENVGTLGMGMNLGHINLLHKVYKLDIMAPH